MPKLAEHGYLNMDGWCSARNWGSFKSSGRLTYTYFPGDPALLLFSCLWGLRGHDVGQVNASGSCSDKDF